MTNFIEPLDPVHQHSAQAVSRIRQWVLDAKMRVAVWDIRPVPKDFR